MAVAGALIGKMMGAFGRKPNIPELPALDPTKVQAETIAANAQSLPQAQQLAGQVNQFNQEQQLKLLTQALDFLKPGTADTVKGTLASQLRGEVPEDVQRQLLRQSVSGAFGRGYGAGSRIASNDYLRNFGLTSLQQQQQGLANFSMFAPQQQYNVSSMFFTPQQRLEFAFQDRQAQFQRNLLAEQVAAAPDPATAALAREIDRFFNTAASAGMTAGGFGG